MLLLFAFVVVDQHESHADLCYKVCSVVSFSQVRFGTYQMGNAI